jgi:hypothetical protein
MRSNDDDYYSSSSSDDDDYDSPEITPEVGLSAGALAALLSFQQTGSCFDENDVDEDAAISKDTVCVAYTANDSAVIAATLRRLQEKQLAGREHKSSGEEEPAVVVISDLQSPLEDGCSLLEALQRDGVVRVNQVLPPDICDQCLENINRKLASEDASAEEEADENTDTTSNGYGNVFSRKNRYDMYLRPSGVSQEALQAMLGRDSQLGALFHALVPPSADTQGVFHEFSSLISDPGSDRQPLHPDAPYADNAPLWTVFCALQDVEIDMGPTVFLLGSNSAAIHDALTNNDTSSMTGTEAQYRRSVLKKGDAAVMDARTLHYGGANTSDTRRVLLYFSIRNPLHGRTVDDFPKCGSLWPDLEATRMTNVDYY